MSDRVAIFDTTLRDGEQSPGCSMNLEEKLRMARQLDALGVDIIEAGFPIASDDDFAAVREVAKTCRRPIIAALCRTTPEDIERAWEALSHAARPRIHTFVATSDIHLQYKLQKSREEVLEMSCKAVRLAKGFTDDVEFSAEDATRSDLDYLCQVIAAVIDEGATVVNIPDTVGYTIPSEYTHIIQTLKTRVPNIDRATISVHCHNDLGLAVANSLAAVAAGARQIECTINGIGERAGNASLEEIVMALRVRKDLMPYENNVASEEIFRSSQTLSNITGVMVQPNKAVVGKNAFAHEAGIHQHGVLKNRITYEIMTPESVGVKTNSIVLGKHSGRHALNKKYEEMGYTLSRPELDKAYKLFTKLADQKKEIFEEDLIAIMQDGIAQIPERFKLRAVQATAGTSTLATALVTLADTKTEESETQTAAGDGPVNAIYEAIDKITGLEGVLVDYTVRSITRGADAVGEVFVHVEFDGVSYTGKAASTDIVDASARAYLNAVNKALYAKERKRATGPEAQSAQIGN
ncbi:MAG TPA: 2-isopropylmalate synthase [Blastocatellia bacterium]|nr:2-isopropylmalate synthase [Blastocatellia bacterium]